MTLEPSWKAENASGKRDLFIDEYIATGGLAHRPLYMQTIANVLNKPVSVHPCQQGPATGAAIFGAMAAEGHFTSAQEAVEAMSTPIPPQNVVLPGPESASGVYDEAFREYIERSKLLGSDVRASAGGRGGLDWLTT